MPGEEQTPFTDDTVLDNYIDSVFNTNDNATPPQSSHVAKIHNLQDIAKNFKDYREYYSPKVVSIGPYHHGNNSFEWIQNLKPRFTMKLLKDKQTLRSLYKKLSEPNMMKELRSFYEKDSGIHLFSDLKLTNMMLLDACFILYHIQSIFSGKAEYFRELKTCAIGLIHLDLMLLENQIPFKVITEVMRLAEIHCSNEIILFIESVISVNRRPKRKWLKSIICIPSGRSLPEIDFTHNLPDHLLHLLHRILTKKFKVPQNDSIQKNKYGCNFQNVNELVDVGIRFKPSDTIEFSKGWWGFSANVGLPTLIVDETTKCKLLNLLAYEKYHILSIEDAWVTSYICLLDSLIDQPEDVKLLRKAWVLETSSGSDKEVVDIFHDLAADLVPNEFAYLEIKANIQKHYESWKNTLLSQLKNEYVKSPWAFLALLGAVIALFLSAVQTYFTVWSPEGTCDDLCMFLKMNHHL